MKVWELTDRLNECDQDAEVILPDYESVRFVNEDVIGWVPDDSDDEIQQSVVILDYA